MKEGEVITYKGRTGKVFRWDDPNAPNINVSGPRLVCWTEDFICIKMINKSVNDDKSKQEVKEDG